MPEVVFVGAVRTPIGSFNGSLSSVPAHVMGQTVIGEALKRQRRYEGGVRRHHGSDPHRREGPEPPRQAAVGAGVPHEITAYRINQVCGSGLRAVALGYQAIRDSDSSIGAVCPLRRTILSHFADYGAAPHVAFVLEPEVAVTRPPSR